MKTPAFTILPDSDPDLDPLPPTTCQRIVVEFSQGFEAALYLGFAVAFITFVVFIALTTPR